MHYTSLCTSSIALLVPFQAVLDNSRTVAGTPTTLDALGFSWISMDDGWQQCNCSTHQDIDPTLPTCSIGDCRGGKCSWHEPGSGNPIVNAHRFPQGMKSLVDYGHSLGLKVGTYLNNCICMEAGKNSPTHYEEDVAWMMASLTTAVTHPSPPRICSKDGTLTDCFAPLRREDEAVHQLPLGAVACCAPAPCFC